MIRKILELSKRCIRCGFCMEACPTYKLTGNEAASPRGRIRLITSVVGEGTPLTADILHSIDLCLGCRACETACPSGVRYGAIVEAFRAHVEEHGLRQRLQAAAKRSLLGMMERPGLFAASLALSAAAARIKGLGPVPSPLARALTGGDSEPLMPVTDSATHVGSLPAYSPAFGERRFTVCMLQGCVMRVLYDRVNRATVRMLQRAGCDVICPPELGCCGALDLHAGLHARGAELVRAFLSTLRQRGFDAVISNSAGCGSTLREYHELLAEDPVWSHDAAELSARVRDVSEFLWAVGLPAPQAPFEATVTYHDACHLAHGQGITEAPRALLASVPGITLVPLQESDMCCGSAGTYNLTQPDMARRLLERKVDNIAATGASVVAMGNPGCMAWIETGLRDRGLPIRVMHVVEILDEVYSHDMLLGAVSSPTTTNTSVR